MLGSPRSIALLPMKANSQRVPGKNFRPLQGKPLFRWILESLLCVDEIAQVVINTDARDILAQHGLTSTDRIVIRDRAPELCGDDVSMNLILADDIAAIEADSYVMTHTTSPMLSAPTIRRALDEYHAAQDAGWADSMFSVNRIQTRFYRECGAPVNHNPARLIPTQDLEPWFEENSCLYLFSRQSFAKTGARIGQTPAMFEIPKLEAVDIDTQEDWAMAEAIALMSAQRQVAA